MRSALRRLTAGPEARTEAHAEASWAAAKATAAAQLSDAGVAIVGGPSRLREAGVMLFSFGGAHAPMRVRVLEATPDASADASASASAEPPPPAVYYDEADVPYERMWKDDQVWMPTLLRSAKSYFEAHFLFEGGPGAQSKLLRHNWRADEVRDQSTDDPPELS